MQTQPRSLCTVASALPPALALYPILFVIGCVSGSQDGSENEHEIKYNVIILFSAFTFSLDGAER